MNAVDLIRGFESCELAAYPDPFSPRGEARRAGCDDPTLDGAPWTIGHGLTGRLSDGRKIQEGLAITQEEADCELAHRAASVERVVRSLVLVPVEAHQLAAMVSLAWNIGTSERGFAGSTVLRELNQSNILAAGDAFRLWNKSRGKVVQGLVNRREAERAVFLKVS